MLDPRTLTRLGTVLGGALVAVLALTVFTTPAFAQDAALDKAKQKAWMKTLEDYATNQDPDHRTWLEIEALKEPPLPAEWVEPLSEHFFTLLMKHGPKLKKSGTNYFYDKKTKKGLYLVAPGKKGGGLLISMHGGGENQGDAGGAHGTWSSAKGDGFTVVSPEVMKKVSSAWNEELEEKMVLDLIDAAKRTFDVDPDRICLAGHSMGGDGSWMIGGRNADLFAACAPLAGSIMPYMKQTATGTALNRIDTPLSDYEGLMEGVIPNLMYVPYHIAHSDDDRNEAIHPDDIATGHLTQLQKLFPGRYQFTYDRITGNGHGLPPGGVKPIIKWLAKQRRVTYPREVIWETWWKWKNQMYWLYHPEPSDAWRFHARIEGTGKSNHIEVSATTKPVQGRSIPKELELTLLLSPQLIDFDRPLKVTSAGEVVYEGPIERSLWALMVSIGRRNDRKQWFEGHVTVKLQRQMWKDLWDAEK